MKSWHIKLEDKIKEDIDITELKQQEMQFVRSQGLLGLLVLKRENLK